MGMQWVKRAGYRSRVSQLCFAALRLGDPGSSLLVYSRAVRSLLVRQWQPLSERQTLYRIVIPFLDIPWDAAGMYALFLLSSYHVTSRLLVHIRRRSCAQQFASSHLASIEVGVVLLEP